MSKELRTTGNVEAEKLVKETLRAIGEDPEREGLLETPYRVVKSWTELFSGYKEDPKKILETSFSDVDNYNQIVLLKDIEFFSFCEHHMLPFLGKAHVAYIPQGNVVGLSKLARLVDCFARRLQIQERLTKQIADAIVEELNPLGVAVVVEAKHYCMHIRGVKKYNSMMVTSSVHGAFENESTREEFLKLINIGK